MIPSSASLPPPVDEHTALPPAYVALAPLDLPNYRQGRYAADDLCVNLASLAPVDAEILSHQYTVLSELLRIFIEAHLADAEKWQAVTAWTQANPPTKLTRQAQELGGASLGLVQSELLAKTVHDLRGGALTALLGRLQALAWLPQTVEQLNMLFILTRDQLKIMRSAVAGLDDARRHADRTPKAHAMKLMLEKWHRAVVGPHAGAQAPRLEMDCRYEGPLTECCLESAAIDRIFYNLANNATRHAVGRLLRMVIFPLQQAATPTLRFVLANEINAQDATFLQQLAPAPLLLDACPVPDLVDLPALFAPATSSTGSGFGLTVVADFVTGAFALESREDCIERRYVGAALLGQTFITWFHWPAGHDDLPVKLDDYHYPAESLSGAPP